MQALNAGRLNTSRRDGRVALENLSLMRGLVENGRAHLLPVLPSALASDILLRGYDPRTLDRVYRDRAAGSFGPIGRVVDRMVLDMPLHEALRERLDAAVGELCAAVVVRARENKLPCRVLMAPCGLGREILAADARLRVRHPELVNGVEWFGAENPVDPGVLAEAAERSAAAGVTVRWLARNPVTLKLDDIGGRPCDVIVGLGSTFQRSVGSVGSLIRTHASLLKSGGVLLVDRWDASGKHRLSRAMSIESTPVSRTELHRILRSAGLSVEREHPTGSGGCTLTVCRKA